MRADGIGGGWSGPGVCGLGDHRKGLGAELWEWHNLIFFYKRFLCLLCGDWIVEGQESKQRHCLEGHCSGPSRDGCLLRMAEGAEVMWWS